MEEQLKKYLKLLFDYYYEIEQGNFWVNAEKTLNSSLWIVGLFNVLFKKNIIAKGEWEEGIALAKKQYKKEIELVEQRIEESKRKVEKIEEEIQKNNDEQTDLEKITRELFEKYL